MSQLPETRRTDGPTDEGEQICHIVTEEDPDTALCGKDVTGWPGNPPWPYCLVCLDLAGGDAGGPVVADVSGEDWERDRLALLDRSLSLSDLLARRGLHLE